MPDAFSPGGSGSAMPPSPTAGSAPAASQLPLPPSPVAAAATAWPEAPTVAVPAGAAPLTPLPLPPAAGAGVGAAGLMDLPGGALLPSPAQLAAAPLAAVPVTPAPLMPALLEQIAVERRRMLEESEAAARREESEAAARREDEQRQAVEEEAAKQEARARWKRVVGVCATAALLMYSTRTSISTAIVPMAEQFGWDKQFCGTVLSAFFAGYSVTQVWGGQLSDKYGGSAVLFAGLIAWSLFSALTPLAAAHSAPALLAARAGVGAAQGVAFPAIHALLAKGVPPSRRGGAIGTIMALAHSGTALASFLSPALIKVGGWAFSFYAFAGLAAAWALPWLTMHRDLHGKAQAAAAAAPHPAQRNTQQQQQQQQQQQPPRRQSGPGADRPGIGFWPLMRRKEVWAIAAAQYSSSFGLYGLLAWLPSFFMEHCGLQLSQLGGYTLIPYLLQATVGAFAGVLADHLIQRCRWRVRDVRVLMQCAAQLGPAAALVMATSPVGASSPQAAVGFITLGMGLSALSSSGVSASHLDIAPRHAGVVFGVGNTAGTLAGLIAVPATGAVLHHTGSWALAFALAAAHNVLGAVVWARWVGDQRLREDGGPEPEAAQQPDAASELRPKAA